MSTQPHGNGAGNLGVAWALLRRSRPWQWPHTAYYFLGVALKKKSGIRLFDSQVLRYGDLKVHGDVDGGCGLVFLHEIWGKKTYDAAQGSDATPEAVLFDVGANCGFYALRRALANPQLRAYCFEPHPRTFRILEQNIQLNGLADRIKAIPHAVGAASGFCPLTLDTTSSMAVVGEAAPGQTTIQVPLSALDDYCCAHSVWPDALKIDVEGFEVEVLSGAQECLKRAKRLVLEYHNDELRQRCLALLEPAFHTRIVGSLIFGQKR